MTEQTHEHTVSKSRGRGVVGVAVGIVIGLVVAGVAVWQLMPGMMIVRHRSPYGLDETVGRLERAIAEQGWNHPATRNMNASLERQGVHFGPNVRLVELCKAEYATGVLRTDRELATLMPCAFAVYEDDAGRVWVSGMNTGLMGQMFGGNVAEVMGKHVAADEKAILAAAIGVQ